jgi:glutamate synthase domain-containing protein 2/glutamate synthase domain-containing protein 1/glutamate synthase domain-containing protein 3
MKRSALRQGRNLPAAGDYAISMHFLPPEKKEREFWQNQLQQCAREYGLEVLFMRDVPCDASVLGQAAKLTKPHIQQAVFVRQSQSQNEQNFDWKLFAMRKNLENLARQRYGVKQREFYIASLSRENICYKALTSSDTLGAFYTDLQNSLFVSAYAMVHLRFSTNTLPSWPLAQPFRVLCHNGEINTLRGNINAMHARSFLFKSETLQKDIDRLGPICTPAMSDSAMLDNAVEFLLHSGRPLAQVMSMVIPEPWEKHSEMSQELKDYFEYQSYLMEPWDGPALIAFCQGQQVGALLDRNGLRPARYWITTDGHVIMASEAGVVERSAEQIVEKGRLSAGRFFLVDMAQGRIVPDDEIKAQLAVGKPYGDWLKSERVFADAVFREENSDETVGKQGQPSESQSLPKRMQAFGYTQECLRLLIAPMANEGKEPDGSMGTDTPLAVLSAKNQLLYNYFKQLFAQVTNPPIDAMREELVTSLSTHLGGEQNILTEGAEHCSVVRLNQPILGNAQLRQLLKNKVRQLNVVRLSSTFDIQTENLQQALDRLCKNAVENVQAGKNVVVLSDREVCNLRAAIPALLVTSAVHHALIRAGERTRCSLVVESGEPREVHHFALLIGYGAAAINPYLALEIIATRDRNYSFKPELTAKKLEENYCKAICSGLLKVMSKMGISTLHSYRGSQIFEALGLNNELIENFFTWTPSRIGGIGLAELEADIRAQHALAFKHVADETPTLPEHMGQYHWRAGGERHLHSPEMISTLQNATRINSFEEFKKFCAVLDETNNAHLHLRSLLSISPQRPPVELSSVEPAQAIVRRFATGAMSFGSLSKEAHETIAVAMNRIGARSNSGEGGEDPQRSLPDSNGDSRRSAIRQVASARFGVTSSYLVNADELQIKMAQGAKPGEGGQLPGHKVDASIAKVRHSSVGITLISPPPHHDIYSIEDLAQLIFDLRNANRSARISVKLVSESGIGTIAAGVAKAKADVILISGHEGGTGASPLSSIKHAGLPWELGLAETHRTLVENNLRERVILQTDGQLRTPRDIAIATLLGAEEWGIATGALVTLGCVMMRKCHLNTCPVGIATQDPELRKKFAGTPEALINYVFMLAEGLREIMAQLGYTSVDEMVGQSQNLRKKEVTNDRLAKIDLDFLLKQPDGHFSVALREKSSHIKEIESGLDMTTLLPALNDSLSSGRRVSLSLPISNLDRSVGTLVSSEISRLQTKRQLPEELLKLTFRGIAGQSFMAFAVAGISALLEGEANDYLCKGLSGAKVSIRPPRQSLLVAENSVICGNTALYGATSGELYARGRAGERFAVRNSGAHAVVEGVGDHGCEYMTGGSVVVLGPIGRNFAAGMSGGIAYVYDPKEINKTRINTELVQIDSTLSQGEEKLLLDQLRKHAELTDSSVAHRVLENWHAEKHHFISVCPPAYRAMLNQNAQINEEPESSFRQPILPKGSETHRGLHG